MIVVDSESAVDAILRGMGLHPAPRDSHTDAAIEVSDLATELLEANEINEWEHKRMMDAAAVCTARSPRTTRTRASTPSMPT